MKQKKMRFYITILSLFMFTVVSAQQVQLTGTYCNTVLVASGSNFYWTSNGAEEYRVRITQGIDTWIFEPGLKPSGTPKTYTNLVSAGVGPQVGFTYNVEVDYKTGGVWQEDWGTLCTLTTPSPTIELTPTYCNSNLVSSGSNFYWTTNGAEEYRVRITEGVDTWLYEVGLTGAGSPKTYTNLVTAGVVTNLSTVYNVEVDYKVSGTWQNDWGSLCTVTTPAPLTTELTPTYCNSNLGVLGSNFYWSSNGAEEYRIRVTEGIDTWIYEVGLTGSGSAKTYTNLISAGIGPQYGTTYNVEVDYSISSVWQDDWGTLCTVTTPDPPVIELESSYCNSSLPGLTSFFRAENVSGATIWRFRVTNTVTGETKVVEKGPSFGSTINRRTTSVSELASLSGTGSLTAIGQAIYTIECSVSVQGGSFNDYGNACNVTITESIDPLISPEECGISHNYIFQDYLNATPPAVTTGCTYEFKLVDQSDFSEIESGEIVNPFIKIYDIPGYSYGKTYHASARCYRQGITGEYGPTCTLFTEGSPYTKIQDGQFSTVDNCDVSIPTFTQRLYAFAIPGGKYQFEIDNGTVYLHQTSNVRSFRLSEVAGYVEAAGTVHNIRVRVSMDNYGSYGPWGEICTATTPLALPEIEEDYLRDTQGENLQLTIYPNPSSSEFKIGFVDENLFQKITMSVYDYTGKLVYESDLDKRDLNSLTFGSDFSNGLYQLIFNDDSGRVERFRLFKSE